MNKWVWRYSIQYLKTLVYMLQTTEYKPRHYMAWLKRTSDFSLVQNRQSLNYTTKSTLLLTFLLLIDLVMFVGGIVGLYLAMTVSAALFVYAIVVVGVLFLLAPYIEAYIILGPLLIGELAVQRPRERRIFAKAKADRNKIRGIVIAIVGSYGKTTFKETLSTVLSEKYNVASTPGNMNTLHGTSRFFATLNGDEDVIICELGESYVGDINALCELIQPQYGVITGINQAHLETFGTIEMTTNTIFEIEPFVDSDSLYKNVDNELVRLHANDDKYAYSSEGVHGWRVSKTETSLHGTKFTVKKGKKSIDVNSKLIGVHQVGPIVACIDIADRLGLTKIEIERGVAKTTAFEHRMRPYQLAGATIIDDTYNGNVDGVMSGLRLLKKESARRVYVTPGLVEQGDETEHIHVMIGEAMADSCDVAVLMKNSVTKYIIEGLTSRKFVGKLQLVDDPLHFYENLDQFVADGDVVLMQNDWTDNYY